MDKVVIVFLKLFSAATMATFLIGFIQYINEKEGSSTGFYESSYLYNMLTEWDENTNKSDEDLALMVLKVSNWYEFICKSIMQKYPEMAGKCIVESIRHPSLMSLDDNLTERMVDTFQPLFKKSRT